MATVLRCGLSAYVKSALANKHIHFAVKHGSHYTWRASVIHSASLHSLSSQPHYVSSGADILKYDLAMSSQRTFTTATVACGYWEEQKQRSPYYEQQQNRRQGTTGRVARYPPRMQGYDRHEEKSSTSEVFEELIQEKPIDTEEAEKNGAFEKYSISPKTVENLKQHGINYLFPVQTNTYKNIQDGEDVIVRARTGTGKTLSFALPLVEMLLKKDYEKVRGRMPQLLVMAPTRELAVQVSNEFRKLTDSLTICPMYGGTRVDLNLQELSKGIDILVGTPGRLKDLVQRNALNCSQINHIVLDEVDKMLDMGFAEDVEEIIRSAYRQAPKPQTLLWSATVPDWVQKTARKYMGNNYKTIDLVGKDRVKIVSAVKHLAVEVPYGELDTLVNDLITVYCGEHGKALVFSATKRGCDDLKRSPHMNMKCQAMHGDVPQSKRELILSGFRMGKYQCLITTDVAARGLDIDGIDLVIQTTPPQDVDSYIHRAGRTGRAGKGGVSIVLYSDREKNMINNMESRAGVRFKQVTRPVRLDLQKAKINDAVKSMTATSPDMIEAFKGPIQESSVMDMDIVDLVSRSLAYLAFKDYHQGSSEMLPIDQDASEDSQVLELQIKNAIETAKSVLMGGKVDVQSYRESAERLVSKFRSEGQSGDVGLLAAAFSTIIPGSDMLMKKSLITGNKGFTTFTYRTTHPLNGPGSFINAMNTNLGSFCNMISNETFCADMQGVTFDLPSKHEKAVLKRWRDTHSEFIWIPDTLPVLNKSMKIQARYNGSDSYGQNRQSRGSPHGRGTSGGWQNKNDRYKQWA